MGYNATLVVLTDRLDEIERDPEFGKKVAAAIRYHSAYGKEGIRERSAPYVTGQTQVVGVEHADVMQIVAVGGNCGRTIGYGSRRQNDNDLILCLERERRRQSKAIKEEPVGG